MSDYNFNTEAIRRIIIDARDITHRSNRRNNNDNSETESTTRNESTTQNSQETENQPENDEIIINEDAAEDSEVSTQNDNIEITFPEDPDENIGPTIRLLPTEEEDDEEQSNPLGNLLRRGRELFQNNNTGERDAADAADETDASDTTAATNETDAAEETEDVPEVQEEEQQPVYRQTQLEREWNRLEDQEQQIREQINDALQNTGETFESMYMQREFIMEKYEDYKRLRPNSNLAQYLNNPQTLREHYLRTYDERRLFIQFHMLATELEDVIQLKNHLANIVDEMQRDLMLFMLTHCEENVDFQTFLNWLAESIEDGEITADELESCDTITFKHFATDNYLRPSGQWAQTWEHRITGYGYDNSPRHVVREIIHDDRIFMEYLSNDIFSHLEFIVQKYRGRISIDNAGRFLLSNPSGSYYNVNRSFRRLEVSDILETLQYQSIHAEGNNLYYSEINGIYQFDEIRTNEADAKDDHPVIIFGTPYENRINIPRENRLGLNQRQREQLESERHRATEFSYTIGHNRRHMDPRQRDITRDSIYRTYRNYNPGDVLAIFFSDEYLDERDDDFGSVDATLYINTPTGTRNITIPDDDHPVNAEIIRRFNQLRDQGLDMYIIERRLNEETRRQDFNSIISFQGAPDDVQINFLHIRITETEDCNILIDITLEAVTEEEPIPPIDDGQFPPANARLFVIPGENAPEDFGTRLFEPDDHPINAFVIRKFDEYDNGENSLEDIKKLILQDLNNQNITSIQGMTLPDTVVSITIDNLFISIEDDLSLITTTIKVNFERTDEPPLPEEEWPEDVNPDLYVRCGDNIPEDSEYECEERDITRNSHPLNRAVKEKYEELIASDNIPESEAAMATAIREYLIEEIDFIREKLDIPEEIENISIAVSVAIDRENNVTNIDTTITIGDYQLTENTDAVLNIVCGSDAHEDCENDVIEDDNHVINSAVLEKYDELFDNSNGITSLIPMEEELLNYLTNEYGIDQIREDLGIREDETISLNISITVTDELTKINTTIIIGGRIITDETDAKLTIVCANEAHDECQSDVIDNDNHVINRAVLDKYDELYDDGNGIITAISMEEELLNYLTNEYGIDQIREDLEIPDDIRVDISVSITVTEEGVTKINTTIIIGDQRLTDDTDAVLNIVCGNEAHEDCQSDVIDNDNHVINRAVLDKYDELYDNGNGINTAIPMEEALLNYLINDYSIDQIREDLDIPEEVNVSLNISITVNNGVTKINTTVVIGDQVLTDNTDAKLTIVCGNEAHEDCQSDVIEDDNHVINKAILDKYDELYDDGNGIIYAEPMEEALLNYLINEYGIDQIHENLEIPDDIRVDISVSIVVEGEVTKINTTIVIGDQRLTDDTDAKLTIVCGNESHDDCQSDIIENDNHVINRAVLDKYDELYDDDNGIIYATPMEEELLNYLTNEYGIDQIREDLDIPDHVRVDISVSIVVDEEGVTKINTTILIGDQRITDETDAKLTIVCGNEAHEDCENDVIEDDNHVINRAVLDKYDELFDNGNGITTAIPMERALLNYLINDYGIDQIREDLDIPEDVIVSVGISIVVENGVTKINTIITIGEQRLTENADPKLEIVCEEFAHEDCEPGTIDDDTHPINAAIKEKYGELFDNSNGITTATPMEQALLTYLISEYGAAQIREDLSIPDNVTVSLSIAINVVGETTFITTTVTIGEYPNNGVLRDPEGDPIPDEDDDDNPDERPWELTEDPDPTRPPTDFPPDIPLTEPTDTITAIIDPDDDNEPPLIVEIFVPEDIPERPTQEDLDIAFGTIAVLNETVPTVNELLAEIITLPRGYEQDPDYREYIESQNDEVRVTIIEEITNILTQHTNIDLSSILDDTLTPRQQIQMLRNIMFIMDNESEVENPDNNIIIRPENITSVRNPYNKILILAKLQKIMRALNTNAETDITTTPAVENEINDETIINIQNRIQREMLNKYREYNNGYYSPDTIKLLLENYFQNEYDYDRLYDQEDIPESITILIENITITSQDNITAVNFDIILE
ncbi:hypothetical protein ACFL56_02375 [Candidatus Margulisiibacteriota bacterium]